MDLEKDFGNRVFNDGVMRRRLPGETYRALRRTINEGRHLDPQVAHVVANAMKDWAIEQGATHYTHWFQPMTGVTAEKHDSFLSPLPGGRIIMDFSGKELVRGEPDASSFPSGGLRATFEARGYTAWDPSSYAFIKGRTLCIPTAFCSWGGHALDQKTPLLRSIQAISHEAKRILRLFGMNDVKRVMPTCGPEQEYFLIDREYYDSRKDLKYCGRTLFGARPPKGQELDDHYFGSLKPRVAEFMKDVDEELWSLGVMAKTEHNEVAPCQHELASVYESVNVAVDHNQLTMEVLRKAAARHGFACLLHEKPFMGVNGSGKHNNWSLQTDTGVNLLEPGDTPVENALFLLMLAAVIAAVDRHGDLLRASVAGAGNEHRLGASEAPPATVSMYLGDELTGILDALVNHNAYTPMSSSEMDVGVRILPAIPRDTSDRNRTSPFAFTGNKFEFRMPGASMNVAACNTVINTAVADELRMFADRLEKVEDLRGAVQSLIIETVSEHKRIIFNGNNYSDEWKAEARRRGLKDLRTLPECASCLLEDENVALFERMKVYTREELRSRYEILMEHYSKVKAIEANTMLDMTGKQYQPAIIRYSQTIAGEALKKQALLPDVDASYEKDLLRDLDRHLKDIELKKRLLQELTDHVPGDGVASAVYFSTKVNSVMEELRALVDECEGLVDETVWPVPSYGRMLTQREGGERAERDTDGE